MEKEKKSGTLEKVTDRTKAITLTTLAVETLFLASLPVFPAAQKTQLLWVFGAILAITVAGLIFLEYKVPRANDEPNNNGEPFLLAALHDISHQRRTVLTGSWSGTGLQKKGPGNKSLKFPFEMHLSVSGRVVQGTGSAQFKLMDEEINARFEVHGGFLLDRFLKLDYRNSDGSVVQFGSFVLLLDDGEKLLTGTLAGYGFKSKRPVAVELELRKPNKS
jgi:hypothetical protein